MPACVRVSASVLCAALATVLVPAHAHDNDDHELEIVTLSNRADLISGGDALIEVRVPKNASVNKVKVKLNGTDVTGAFRKDAAARTLTGLVTTLVEGSNDLVAEIDERGHG